MAQPTTARNIGMIRIYGASLLELIRGRPIQVSAPHIPAGARFAGFIVDPHTDTLYIRVEGEGLPLVLPGQSIPVVGTMEAVGQGSEEEQDSYDWELEAEKLLEREDLPYETAHLEKNE